MQWVVRSTNKTELEEIADRLEQRGLKPAVAWDGTQWLLGGQSPLEREEINDRFLARGTSGETAVGTAATARSTSVC